MRIKIMLSVTASVHTAESKSIDKLSLGCPKLATVQALPSGQNKSFAVFVVMMELYFLDVCVGLLC